MQRKNKNIIIGMLCCMLVFMGVGYAVFQQALNITSTGSISSKWNIKITSVTEENRNGYISNVVTSHDDLTAEVSAVFQAPGDWIEFRIRVENQGTIDAILEDVKLTKNDNGDKEYIDVKISGIEAPEELNRGGVKEFIVRIEFDPDVTELPNQEEDYKIVATIGLKYVQKGSTTGSGSGNSSSLCYSENVDGSVTYNYACGTEVAVPATTEDGTPITTIDNTTFMRKNAALFNGTIESTGEAIQGAVIYDEENYDTLKAHAEVLISQMSTSSIKVNPSKLNEVKPSSSVEQMADSSIQFYKGSELASLGLSDDVQFTYVYIDLVSGQPLDTAPQITKLDLSQATHLTTIEESAFENSPVQTIIFGDNSKVTTIGKKAFKSCQLNGELIIPASVTTIEGWAFKGTSEGDTNRISKLTFENGSQLKSIGEYAFGNNIIEGTLTLPDSLTTIENWAFSVNQITEVNLGSKLTSIGDSAFSAPLTTINVDMTEAEFANVSGTSNWILSQSLTINYKNS